MAMNRPEAPATLDEHLQQLRYLIQYYIRFYHQKRKSLWEAKIRYFSKVPRNRVISSNHIIQQANHAKAFNDWYQLVMSLSEQALHCYLDLWRIMPGSANKESFYANTLHAIRNRIIKTVKLNWPEEYQQKIDELLAEVAAINSQITREGMAGRGFDALIEQRNNVLRKLCYIEHDDTLIHHRDLVSNWNKPVENKSKIMILALQFQPDFFDYYYNEEINLDKKIRIDLFEQIVGELLKELEDYNNLEASVEVQSAPVSSYASDDEDDEEKGFDVDVMSDTDGYITRIFPGQAAHSGFAATPSTTPIASGAPAGGKMAMPTKLSEIDFSKAPESSPFAFFWTSPGISNPGNHAKLDRTGGTHKP